MSMAQPQAWRRESVYLAPPSAWMGNCSGSLYISSKMALTSSATILFTSRFQVRVYFWPELLMSQVRTWMVTM